MKDQVLKRAYITAFNNNYNSQEVRKAFLSNENVVHALQDLLEWDKDDNEFVQDKTQHTYNGYVLAASCAQTMPFAELYSICSSVHKDVEKRRVPITLQKYFENSCKVTDLFGAGLFGTLTNEKPKDLFELANDPTDPSTLYADCSVEDCFVGFAYYFLHEFNADIMQEAKQEA